MGYHGSTKQSEVNSSSISWRPVAQNQNISKYRTFLKSTHFSYFEQRHRRILCPAASSLCTFSNILRPMTTPSKQYWIPERTFLDTDTHTKLPDCLSPTIFNSAWSKNFVVLARTAICSQASHSLLLQWVRTLPSPSVPASSCGPSQSSYGIKPNKNFSLVSTCEFFEREIETDSDFGGDTVIHHEMWSALSSEHAVSPS